LLKRLTTYRTPSHLIRELVESLATEAEPNTVLLLEKLKEMNQTLAQNISSNSLRYE